MRRYIESALRLKFRLLIGAALVAGVVFAVLYLSKAGYTSTATVWVAQSSYFNTNLDWNTYISPADNQANALSELLHTRTFALGVAGQAGIPMPTESATDIVVDDLQRNIHAASLGTHLVQVSYTAQKPDYTMAVVSQTILIFTAQMNAEMSRQAQVALQVYQTQRSDYEQQMNKSQADLAKYIQNNPESSAAGTTPDPALVALQQQYAADRSRYDDIVQKIDQVDISSAASQAGDDLFRVVDQPEPPAPFVRTSKQLLTNAGLALALGLFTLVALILVATWTDPSLHTLYDLSALAPADEDNPAPPLLVGAVPYLKTLAAQRKQATQAAKQKSKTRPVVEAQPVAEARPAPAVAPRPVAEVSAVAEARPAAVAQPLAEVRSTAEVQPAEVPPVAEVRAAAEIRPSVEVEPIAQVQVTSEIAPAPEIKPAPEVQPPVEYIPVRRPPSHVTSALLPETIGAAAD